MIQNRLETLEHVVPRIYVALPGGGAGGVALSPENSPVERRLAADLVIFYAFDLDTHFQIVAQRDLVRLGVTADELQERALQNLRALNLQVRAHQGENILLLSAGGNYEATLLLLPEVWESLKGMVTGEIVVAVPARDAVLVTGDATKENLAELRRGTSKVIEHAAKPLSRHFLRWQNDHWEKYEGYAD